MVTASNAATAAENRPVYNSTLYEKNGRERQDPRRQASRQHTLSNSLPSYHPLLWSDVDTWRTVLRSHRKGWTLPVSLVLAGEAVVVGNWDEWGHLQKGVRTRRLWMDDGSVP